MIFTRPQCDFREVAPGVWRCPECGRSYRGLGPAIARCQRPPRQAAPPALQPSAPAPQPFDHWQQWREEAGRWIAVGHVPPGYAADPPQFDPLPGEVQYTPAFPA